MLRVVGGVCRRAIEQAIRILEEALSLAIMLVLAFAPAAGAIAVGYLVRGGLMAVALLAATSLGAFVVWRFRGLWNRPVDRFEPERAVQRGEAPAPSVVAPTMVPVTNDLLAFHDFDRAKNRFDHW
jgi:UPF0716 family protein affecting phage T7 exclusion